MRIEITLWWHADTVEVKRTDDVDRFTIGMRPEDDLFVPLANTEGASHTLIARGPDGRMWLWPLDQPPRLVDAACDVEMALGAFTLRVRTVSRERGVPVLSAHDTRFANISTLTGAAMVALVAVLVLAPTPVRAAPDALPAAMLRTWFTHAVKKQPKLWLPKSPAPTAPDEPSQAKRTHAPPRFAETAESRGAARGALSLALMTALLSDGPVAGGGALTGELSRALGEVGRADRGTTELSLKPGSLRASTDSIGIGGLRALIRGKTEGGGESGSGHLCGSDLGCKKDHDVTMTAGRPVLVCGGDTGTACDDGKEIIKRVVASHRDQLRFCYERALQASPGLAGKASIEWAISATGTVTVASVKESDLPASVSGCLVDKVKSWRFPPVPAWKDGVVVRYPFVFRHH